MEELEANRKLIFHSTIKNQSLFKDNYKMSNASEDSEQEDQLHLYVTGREITRLLIDYQLTLQVWIPKDTLEIKLATNFVFTSGQASYVINPENRTDICRALTILHQELNTVTATNHGRLTITFQSGDQIISEPDEAYEAWSLCDSSGLLVIARPSGGIDYFAPKKDKI
jgi:hypothetical protein